ncbi:aminotransferase, classes I and II family protein [Trichomonas vaginalis G3]|uniref:serine C-palmitoyltransferase n=1 Tax=Trichomonas vaginalis (strain ATCC PRA-98 / G3) TaxID=412133 RepID=A2DYJ7_TRIV3|nr:class II aminotransferase/8-amino-7-oxononanoate synthase family [Trichomonas vaginalis G3]EAY14532.1 aminotransferase, classes I and II family protein [Trichomonas vaginalis G3]KAI5529295.1 class II aminotransferase/8-amino-7-oxononanoate synthase family [Trichomonas vaginalis G3]|eukprot:XP_001326755.1 aminotransferase, classes I and II family protein [Trichomonas vaginalis G3]
MLPELREIELKFFAYLNYVICFITGIVRDWIDRRTGKGRKPAPKGYVPIFNDFADFFTRRYYHRIDDCFARVVTSNAGAFMDVKVAKKADDLAQNQFFTGETRRIMNLGSYNYLGFGDPDEYCTPVVKQVLDKYGPATSSSRVEAGTTQIHKEFEEIIAKFLGTEDAISFGMGWATNATVIPAFMKKGDLIISDALNHNSIITGARASGAAVRVFKHNDMENLEQLLRSSISRGQPRTHQPWGKILVIVEGIYSMEGETCKLREIVALKKQYKFYIWLDEAHSIGCMGDTGRGVTEHLGVNPKDVDFLMGTFTKSFGAAGGYIAGSKQMINYLRLNSFANIYADAMPVPVAQQAMSVIKVLMENEEGKKRISQLHENATWFREELKRRNFKVLSEDKSPVVPIIIPPFSYFTEVSRKAFELGLGLVVVSFPACDILQGRIRICINSIHTREELQHALDVLEECVKDIPAKTQ